MPAPLVSSLRQGELVDTHVICACFDLSVESVLILVPEWWVSDQEDVEDDAASPDVHGLGVGLFLQHFRREVARGASKTEPRLLVAKSGH